MIFAWQSSPKQTHNKANRQKDFGKYRTGTADGETGGLRGISGNKQTLCQNEWNHPWGFHFMRFHFDLWFIHLFSHASYWYSRFDGFFIWNDSIFSWEFLIKQTCIIRIVAFLEITVKGDSGRQILRFNGHNQRDRRRDENHFSWIINFAVAT